MPIEIKEVDSPELLKEFIRLPWKIYEHYPRWVPPLISEEKKLFNPQVHPFYEHAEVKLFLGYRYGEPWGRIAGIVNHNHNKFHNDRVGFFGFYESSNDADLSRALCKRVRDYLHLLGHDRMQGPMSFSTNETCGMLVKGFDQPPYVMMPYNPPYYPKLMEYCGLQKVKDLHAFHMRRDSYNPRLDGLVERLRKRFPDVSIRSLDSRRMAEEIEVIREIYNSAWERNWGFVPMTENEFDYLARSMRKVVDPRYCLIAEMEGQPVGFMLALPNLNLLLKKMNGRLFPFGFLHFVFGLKKIRAIRVLTMGVKKEYRHRGIDLLCYHHLVKLGQELGVDEGEFSWVLEDNTVMNDILQQIGARVYKVYRIYEQPI